MDMTPENYQDYVAGKARKSPLLKDIIMAFVIGGAICVLGQIIRNGWAALGLDDENAGLAASCTLILISALLTGLNLYNKLARYGGAGTLIPITGFANAITAPAIEFRAEGWITGIGSRIFVVAGPVLAYGAFASVIYGVILMIAR